MRFELVLKNDMWTLDLNPEDILEINYEDLNFPRSFLAFKPILFKSGGIYCCLLGPSQQEGIFGFGKTVGSAICVWDLEFKKRLMSHSKNDAIAQFVSYKIRMFKNMQHS
jgi:hypothetical protein